MDRHERIEDQLAKVPLFSSLSKKELKLISQLATYLEEPEGTVLTEEGKPGHEFIIVLDGEISFFVGDARYDLQGGQVAYGPRGVPHSYLVRSPRSRMAVVYAPAGIDEWFRGNGTPVAHVDDAPASFDIGAIIASAEAFNLRVVGPPPQQA